MTQPQLKHVQSLGNSGLYRMAYWEWAYGGPALPEGVTPPVLVCVHGLSRQGRDFDTLARAMQARYRVICPDVVGRGQSAWLSNPAGYQVPAYVADMVTLLARLDVPQVDWVGTSMGGLIGMGLAALPGNPIRRLVLNDVGPTLDFEALQRIGRYLGQPKVFESLDEGAAYLASISQSFGPHTPEQWAALSAPMLKALPGQVGRFSLHYDPAIALPFASMTEELVRQGSAALWQTYDAISCPTLLLRGHESDLLSLKTAHAMGERGPCARLKEFDGVGHAPTLVHAEQINAVAEFLGAA
ncbi:alpha/beta fold hydrolase [Roseateles koreensis]|uniref:Alpha/beta hydrolase n=1 Tax=Roseateles koreensis TaxID=2987526 RepID=A0ABT5KLQ7_9BURK|nr:alpha/beta hydrolase [Roseateles koreensis]MDC8783789.1 alpha/beta hydrolase [Roseateles koreensis]